MVCKTLLQSALLSYYVIATQTFLQNGPSSSGSQTTHIYPCVLLFPHIELSTHYLPRALHCNHSPSCVQTPNKLIIFLCWSISFIISISEMRSARSLSVALSNGAKKKRGHCGSKNRYSCQSWESKMEERSESGCLGPVWNSYLWAF